MILFPRNRRHSLAYYFSVLQILLAGITARHRQAAIADSLNGAGIQAATGSDWTEQAVKAVLKRLRARTGPVYHALLQLHFDGKLTRTQAQCLLQTL